MNTDRQTALPLYLQISESLIRDIAAGHLIEGERLPPERDLAKQLGTTVRTLRKSLAELEKRGLLERVQGSGNYVRNPGGFHSIYSMFRLELRQGGGLPTADFLTVERMNKPDDLPAFGSADDATRFRRLRYLDDIPVAIEEVWLDGNAGNVDVARLSDSLYRSYKQQFNLVIQRAEDYVAVAAVPDWAPSSFPPAHHTMTGYIERKAWGPTGTQPVEFSRTWFDPATAHYVQRFR